MDWIHNLYQARHISDTPPTVCKMRSEIVNECSGLILHLTQCVSELYVILVIYIIVALFLKISKVSYFNTQDHLVQSVFYWQEVSLPDLFCLSIKYFPWSWLGQTDVKQNTGLLTVILRYEKFLFEQFGIQFCILEHYS